MPPVLHSENSLSSILLDDVHTEVARIMRGFMTALK